jgi:hypothetical protein
MELHLLSKLVAGFKMEDELATATLNIDCHLSAHQGTTEMTKQSQVTHSTALVA